MRGFPEQAIGSDQLLDLELAGLELLENAIATAHALGALILTFGPVFRAHLNRIVSAVDWWLGRRAGTGPTARDLAAYTAAKIGGAITRGSWLTSCSTSRPWPGPARPQRREPVAR
ncbi:MULTISPECIES: hypothetical protein [Micromonospora]